MKPRELDAYLLQAQVVFQFPISFFLLIHQTTEAASCS
jgi:hypothetical protein